MARIDALKKEARKAEERQDWSRAIEYYRRAVEEAERDGSGSLEVGLYNRIGDLYLKLDDSPHAVYHYLLAVDEYAEDALYTPAIALCRKILRVAPQQVDAHRKLARLHEATGLMADAREEMDRYMAGVWESGEVNGALDGLPELVASLMKGEPELEEVRRLRDEGKPEEAFELLYRQWEDDANDWEEGPDDRASAAPEPSASGSSDRTLGESLRRGWRGLFGGGPDDDGDARPPEIEAAAPAGEASAGDAPGTQDEVEVEGPEIELIDPESAGADAAGGGADEADAGAEAEDAAAGGDAAGDAPDDGLNGADDMAWLREVTASRVPVPDDEEKGTTKETPAYLDGGMPGDDAAEDEGAAAAETGDESPEEAPDADEPVAPAAEAGQEGPEFEIVAHYDEPEGADGEREAAGDDLAEPAAEPASDAGSEDAEPEPDTPEPEPATGLEVVGALEPEVGAGPDPEPAPSGEPSEVAGAPDSEPGSAREASVREGPAAEEPAEEEPAEEEPAGPPVEVLVAAADRLIRPTGTAPALPGGVAGPRLLVAAGPDVQEGRTAVRERPLDRAVRARVRRPAVAGRAAAATLEGPAFQTPGRDDYLPAGAEVAAREPGPGLLWLSDQVALLGAMDRGEAVAVRPVFGPPPELMRSVAEALERSAAAEPAAALPSDQAGPRLLGAGVVEEAWVVDPVVEDAARDERGRRPPEGPPFETPGRDDYLPAGSEIGARLPGEALTWLADAVEELHWLEWGDPEWIEAARQAADRRDRAAQAEEASEEASDEAARAAGQAEAREPEEREGEAPEKAAPRLALPGALLPSPFLPPARAAAEDGEAEAPEETAPEEEPAAAAREEPEAGAADDVAAADAGEPPATAEGEVASDGPSAPTPEDAGAEGEIPTPALAWLAASVADIHRLDRGDPSWLDRSTAGLSDGEEVENPRVRLDRHDPSRPEDAAEATREALAYLAAREAVAGPERSAPESPEPADASDDDGSDEGAATVAEAAVDAAAAPDAPPAADVAEPAGQEVGTAGPRPVNGGAPRTAPVGRPPQVSDPVPQPAARPNGLDFTALLRRIGWLQGSENGHANGHGGGAAAADRSAAGHGAANGEAGSRTAWADGPSSGSEDGGGGGGAPKIQAPKPAAPGSGVPDFTDMLQKVGWLRQDDRA